MPRDGTGGDVEDARLQLAGDLEHVRQHQQQALARRERRCQRTCLQRSVDNAGGTRLRLHLDNLRYLAPQVALARGRPGVGQLSHWARRGYRVDGDDLGELVRDARRRLVSIDDKALRAGLRWHVEKLEVRKPELIGIRRES